MILEHIIKYVDIKKVFSESPETVGHLLFLLDIHMFMNPEKIIKDLLWILDDKADDISLKLYRHIRHFAGNMEWQDMQDMLDKIITLYDRM